MTDAGVPGSTSNCFNSLPYPLCESTIPGLLDDPIQSANPVNEIERSNTQIEEIDFSHFLVPPTANKIKVKQTFKVKQTSQMPIIEPFELPRDHDLQSRVWESHGKTLLKRVRFTASDSSKNDEPSSHIYLSFITDSEAVFTQAWHDPSTFKDRKRLLRVLLGQLSALQVTSEGIANQGETEVKEDLSRPASYPQTQRWRKSLGVSVKALRERVERLSLLRREKRDSQRQPMVLF